MQIIQIPKNSNKVLLSDTSGFYVLRRIETPGWHPSLELIPLSDGALEKAVDKVLEEENGCE